MPDITIYIYDASNSPLQQRGIEFCLFDVSTKTCLDKKLSDDLNPGFLGSAPSSEWGVKLSFANCLNEVEVLVKDPTYKYPGNVLRSLNGMTAMSIYMDLLGLPSTASSVPTPSVPTAAAIANWIDTSWCGVADRRAVYNLVTNYIGTILPAKKDHVGDADFYKVVENFEKAMDRIGLKASLLEG